MKSRLLTTVLYVVFAVIATACNLLTQRGVLTVLDHGVGLIAAMLAGTAAGLIVKYALDKKWIFGDTSTGLGNHSRKFSLYTLMGVFTTALFWGAEALAWIIWNTHFAREAGALVGLAIGYVVKYQLDRRFVFSAPEQTRAA